MKPKAAAFLVPCLALMTAGSLSSQSTPSVWSGPVLVSPGGRGEEGQVGSGCPTFSWALVPEASGYELDVYQAGGDARERNGAAPVLHVEFPAGVGSWTPELRECLTPGRYGWAVAAIVKRDGGEAQRRWSKPALFHVENQAVGHREPERPAHPAGALDSGALALRIGPLPTAENSAPPRTATGEVLFTPQACSGGGEMFTDVPASSPFCRWIEQLARDGISSGCGGGNFCPGEPVTREQMALLLERAMRGTQDFAPAPGGAILTAVDDPVDAVGTNSSIAIGADGLPIISYYDSTANALKVAHCWDRTCAGGNETITTVDDPANDVGAYTSIAIGVDDLPIISYYDFTAKRLKVAHCSEVTCAGILTTITTVNNPSGNQVGEFSSIAIGSDGRPVISYLDRTAGDLVVAYCNDTACAGSNETITAIDGANNVGFHTSIAVGTDGLPIIGYYDQTASALRVAHCNDVACVGANETITTVDNSADVGGFTSIAIGADSLPIISYHDFTALALKVAHCNDVACAGADETITTVDDPTNDVGAYTSIAIGADGLPVISYRDDGAFALKVAHCNDVACAGGNETITTVDDPANSVGTFNSIAIGTDGVPVISYTDSGAAALKVMHCGTLTCAQ